jgi:hypothetical protein
VAETDQIMAGRAADAEFLKRPETAELAGAVLADEADHPLKQHPRWKVDQLPDGTFRWTTPSGRQYDTEPTRYPI